MDFWQTAMEFSKEMHRDCGGVPRLGIVLGSGWGDSFRGALSSCHERSFREIPDLPESGVAGHTGSFLWGFVDKTPVVVINGRIHYYEGHPMATCTLPIRILGAMGVQGLLITNAAGGIREDMLPGSLMVIEDHINLMGDTPLRGDNDARIGPRFPDMTQAYDPDLSEILRSNQHHYRHGIHGGVYLGTSGPSFETPAEIRAFRAMGADAVGMSTVPECIVARHMGIRVAGLSCISNRAAGLAGASPKLSHAEVQSLSQEVGQDLCSFLRTVIPLLSDSLQ